MKNLQSLLIVLLSLILTSCGSPGDNTNSNLVIENESNINQTGPKKPETERWSQEVAEENAEKYPADVGSLLLTKSEINFAGYPYYFKGEIIATTYDELFGGEKYWLVKNEKGYVMPIEAEASENEEDGTLVEVWGTLTGDGYSSNDLGVENVVGQTGEMLLFQYNVIN